MKRLLAAIYFGGLVAEVFVRAPHSFKRRKIEKVERRVTGTERGILTVLTLGSLVLPLVYALTSWLDRADYRLSARGKARVGMAGSLSLVGAVWLLWRAHRDLGTNWSPTLEIGAGHTLTTNGIYEVIRHPMYASQALLALSQALLVQNWLAGPGGLAAFLAMYFLRIPEEERMLTDRFGDAYLAYRARTGGIVPRIGASGR